jgi:miniconductance mechanosensitive channel
LQASGRRFDPDWLHHKINNHIWTEKHMFKGINIPFLGEDETLFLAHPWLETLLLLAGLALAALFANSVVKRLLLKGLNHLLKHTSFGNDQELRRHGVIPRLANIMPALVIYAGISYAPGIPEQISAIVQNVTNSFIILTVSMAVSGGLAIGDIIYHRRPESDLKPIKGYIQVVKILVYAIAAIFIIATLLDKSPVILLSGLGAMTAVLILVFQDTLLSLVAGMQISSGDMVRVGDWIEMPALNADGDVIEISLYTVKVQNFDKTITTIPVRKMVSDSFRNWRGMQESGGRRIKRSVNLDQNNISFLSDSQIERLKGLRILNSYLKEKTSEIGEWNDALGNDKNHDGNTRRLTNIGTFRAYLKEFLRTHPGIKKDMTLLVRQLKSGPEGVPIEIYCFSGTTAWGEYEDLQGDIFDHILAIIPEFGLSVFQEISGNDVRGNAFEAIKVKT